jgi:hypothetical protein
MNLQRIEDLIGKYEMGEASPDEEMQLKDFFMSKDVPFHLKKYKTLFAFYKLAGKEELPDIDFDEKILSAIEERKVIPMNPNKRIKLFYISAVAAGMLILFGLFFRYGINGNPQNETFDDPMLAYAETKKILMKVSANLNSGVNEMKSIKEFNNGLSELEKVSAFQTGLNHLGKVTILDKAKEIITTKNK